MQCAMLSHYFGTHDSRYRDIMSLHMQGRTDLSAEGGRGGDDAPRGKENYGDVEETGRPLRERIEVLEGLVFEKFGGAS